MDNELFLGLSPTAWIALLTVVIAIAAIVQAVIYGAMHGTTKRVERAYVSMSHYPPGLTFGFIGSGSDDPIPKQDVAVKMRICNYGNTPARITRVLVQPLIAIEPLRSIPPYDETLGESFDAVLVKNDHFDYPKPMRIEDSDLRTIKSFANNVAECLHPVTLFIIGYVDYIDGFGTHHRAGYARVYNPWIDSKGIQPDDPTVLKEAELAERYEKRNNLVLVGQVGYNYDRQRNEYEGADWAT